MKEVLKALWPTWLGLGIMLVILFLMGGCTSAVRPNSTNYIGRKMKIVYFHACLDSYAWLYNSGEKGKAETISYCEKLTEDADEGRPKCPQKK